MKAPDGSHVSALNFYQFSAIIHPSLHHWCGPRSNHPTLILLNHNLFIFLSLRASLHHPSFIQKSAHRHFFAIIYPSVYHPLNNVSIIYTSIFPSCHPSKRLSSLNHSPSIIRQSFNLPLSQPFFSPSSIHYHYTIHHQSKNPSTRSLIHLFIYHQCSVRHTSIISLFTSPWSWWLFIYLYLFIYCPPNNLLFASITNIRHWGEKENDSP